MSSRFQAPIRWGALMLMVASMCGVAGAQGTLQADLEKQYKPVKLGNDSTGVAVVEAGKVLVIQKSGILGVPQNNMVFCPSHFQDGTLKQANAVCKMSVQKVSKYLTVGEKIYVTKIDLNLKDEKLILSIMECDSCNGVTDASSMKSQVVFHYPKGYLESADAGQVGDLIGQVFTEDSASGGDTQQAQGGGQADAGQQAAAPAAAAPAAPAAPPASVAMGMSPDQVVGILGQPEKIVNLGAKQIYVYKDLKVTFLNGKVTDAQ
jgi:hypothetical protein